MASVFAQSFCQPQAAAAISHLTSFIGSARAMSNHKDLRLRHQNIGNKHQQQSKAQSSGRDLNGEKEQPPQVTDLCSLLKDVNIVLTSPTLTLIHRARNKEGAVNWAQCHTSANTFFENKIGLPKAEITSQHHPGLPILQTAAHDPLFRRIFKSLVQSHKMHQRGFKTHRSERHTGVGVRLKKEQPDSIMDNVQDFFGSRSDKNANQPPLGAKASPGFSFSATSKSLSDADPETERKLKVAFAEGYKAREENTKKRWSNLRSFIFLALVLWLFVQLFSSNISIKPGGSLGFLNSMTYEVNAEDVNVTFADVKGVRVV